MKASKRNCTLFQRKNKKNDDYKKEFNSHVKVVKYYEGRTPIYPDLVKANTTKMGIQDTRNPSP